MAPNRVKELLEAAAVLSGAGDRAGALRLVDEALRLAPSDAKAKALREKLAPSSGAAPAPAAPAPQEAPTPFAPPPADLFADAQRSKGSNPFLRPAPPPTVGTPAAKPASAPLDPGQHLGDLLHTASASLGPGAKPPPAAELPPGREPVITDPYAARPNGSTLAFGSPDPLGAPPSGETLPFAQRPKPVLQAGTLLTGGPTRPSSSPDAARSGTMLAGEALSRPSSSPEMARAGTLLAGSATANLESMLSDALVKPHTPSKGSRSKARPTSDPKRPSTKGSAARPTSDPKRASAKSGARPTSDPKRPSTRSSARPASNPKRPKSKDTPARPKSSAPYDPMELIDEPPTPGHASAIEQMLRQARELLEFADHTGALEKVETVLAQSPTNADALALKARCEATLTSMFESKLGDLRKKPKLKLRPDEVIWLNLDHRAGFVLAQIDGQVSLDDLFDLSGMSRLDTARILAQLVEEKVIAVG